MSLDLLLATSPFQGHVGPATSLVARLSQRGHRVRWYTGEDYARTATQWGAEYVPMRACATFDGPTSLADCARRFKAIGGQQLSELRELLVVDPPDVVVADPTVIGAQRYAESEDLPFVLLGILPLLYAHPSMQLILQATIPGFEYPHPEVPQLVHIGPLTPARDIPRVDPSAWSMRQWLQLPDPCPPIVHVTQGTIATDPTDLILPTLHACADLPVLVIAQVAQAERRAIPTAMIPANARLVEWVDHRDFFTPYPERDWPGVAVFVTNGGYAGVQQALVAGVPQIVAGGSEDKPEIARRVQWSGIGIDIGMRNPTAASVRNALVQMAETPRYRERAVEFAYRAAQTNAPLVAAELLEQLVPTWQHEPWQEAV